jgi:hypothetical protein
MKPDCLAESYVYRKTFSALCEELKKEKLELTAEKSVWSAKPNTNQLKKIQIEEKEVSELQKDAIVCVEVASFFEEKELKTKIDKINKKLNQEFFSDSGGWFIPVFNEKEKKEVKSWAICFFRN